MERDDEQAPSRLGRYELVESLGRGGMGHVFRARAYAAAGVTKDVCVKRIRPERLGDEGAVRRFIAEARLSIGLAHGNIVPVFDFGRADDGYFLAMEWVDGADLRTILDGGRLPPVCAAYVGACVARALAYAHDPQGAATVHRDVKPANVLISLAGDVKLADFGVAALIGSERGVAGTEGYMAPEQREGAEPTGAADLFSLGVMLCEMFDEVPEALEPLLRSLVAPNPADRPAGADEVAEALEAFVASERVRGAASPRETLRARARRAQRPGSPLRDTLGAELSFLRDGHDATFHSRMDPSAPTQPLRPTAHRRRWIALLALLSLLVGALAVGRWAVPPPARPPDTEERLAGPEVAPATPSSPSEPEVGRVTPGPPVTPTTMGTTTRTSDEAQPAPAPATMTASAVTRERSARGTRLARRQPRARRTEAAADSGRGTLEVNAVPWAHVFVDGRRIGETPLLGIPLPAGVHTVRLVNEPMGASRELRVEVRPDEAARVVVHLTPEGSSDRADPSGPP